MLIALDSSLLVALLVPNDLWHSRAVALWARLNAQVPSDAITWIFPHVPRLYPEVLELMRASSGELNFND